MKILVVGHALVVDANRTIYAELAKLGHEVDIIAPKNWKSNLIKELSFSYAKEIDGHFASVFPLDCFVQGNASFYFFNPFKLYKILNAKKYDVILVHQETWSFSLTQICLLNFFSNSMNSKLYIFSNQNIKKKNLLFMLPIEYFNCSFATRILYPTQGVREVIEWKKIKKKCSLFSYTYDSEFFKKKAKNITDVLKIGYLGRITEEKGIFLLLSAFKMLKKERPNLKLKIAGSGPLVDLIKNEDGIEYLGVIAHSKAHEFYQDLDVFVLPSQTRKFWKEQFGRVLIEAAASGNIVVGSSSGAIPEVLSKIQMPFCFKEDDSHDLYTKLNDALDIIHSQIYEEMTSSSIKKCQEQFTHKNVAKVLESYFKEDSF